MSRLVYGGITIEIQKTHLIHAEDVYDPTGLDYLWTRYTIDVTGVVNPSATAYVTQPGNASPLAGPSPAFLTIANIRDTLSLPRQSLTYFDELGNVMIQSPTFAPVPVIGFVPGGGIINNIVQPPVLLDCDCDGQGPKPLKPPEVYAVQGTGKTVLVRFTISTTINDSIFWVAQGGLTLLGHAAPKPPIILSNRWSIDEDLQEGAWSTRVYRGRAIFRADLLRAILAPLTPVDSPPIPGANRLAVPDDFRSYWAGFYCPKGFQRKQIWVEEDPSGFAVDYQVTDVQMPVTILTSETRAYKIEVIRQTGMSRMSPEGALNKVGEVAGDPSSWLSVFSGSAIGGFIGTAIMPGLGTIIGSAIGGFSSGAQKTGLVPQSWDHLVITASGQPGSKRQDLAGLCYKVLKAIIEKSDESMANESVVLTQDYMGKWCRLEVDLKRPPIATVIKIVSTTSGRIQNVCDLRGDVPADDGITGVTSNTPGIQPVFPGDSNTRGTALEALVAQSLMYPYNEAPAPPTDAAAMQGQVPP